MTKIAIVYYSTYGHVVQLANAIKEGIESVEGVTGELYQVAETLPEEVLTKMHAPPKKDHPIATPDVLKEADGIRFGLPTRFGWRSCWQASGCLLHHGRPRRRSGNRRVHRTDLPGYRSSLLFNNDEIHGGSLWGAGAIAGGDGARQASKLELDVAKVQGESFAQVVKKLAA